MAAQSQRRSETTARVRGGRDHKKEYNMKRLIRVALLTAAALSAASAMQVVTSRWNGGTQFDFIFTADECAAMAESWSNAWNKAADVYEKMSPTRVVRLDGDNTWSGNGILLKFVPLFAVRGAMTGDLHGSSKRLIKEYGRSISWTYTLKRNDALGTIIGAW
jgi:hypothetical protein